jgi:flagellar biosynthesis/type III secretory pathway M-ring protein FliF/YscJ
MGFWAWFWIWVGLSVCALVIFGFIAKSLLNKLGSAGHQAERLAQKAQVLAAAMQNKPNLERPQDSVLADPAIARARLLALQKAKVKKQQQRQRRLIASLKRFDPNESRFH